MALPLILGAVAPAVASIASTVINNRRAKKAHQEALAYNHPKAQKQRLIEAGFSPSYFYGGGSSAANTSPVRETPPVELEPAGQAIQTMVTLAQEKKRLELMDQQVQQEKLQTALLADEAKSKLEPVYRPGKGGNVLLGSKQALAYEREQTMKALDLEIKNREWQIKQATTEAEKEKIFLSLAQESLRKEGIDLSNQALEKQLEIFKRQMNVMEAFDKSEALSGGLGAVLKLFVFRLLTEGKISN